MHVQGPSGFHLGHEKRTLIDTSLREIVAPAWSFHQGRTGRFMLAAAIMVIAGCTSGSGGSALGKDPEPAATQEAQAQAPGASSKFGPTAVGKKVDQFRGDFDKLKQNTLTRSQQLDTIRNQTAANVNTYNNLVGAIRSRLQMGSTPGNPELLANWSQAQTLLTQIDADIATLNTLSAQVSSDAGTSSFLLENIRAAYSLSGALEEDHRQLRLLEDEVNQNAIVIDRALLNLNAEINRQQQVVTAERTGLVQIAADINAGQSYPAQARNVRAIPPAAFAPVNFTDKKPLVKIVFDKPDVTYEPALYQALSTALQRRPDAVFDLVAVAPEGGNPSAAQKNADAVFQSMTNMGLPAERVAKGVMASNKATNLEVHIYVR